MAETLVMLALDYGGWAAFIATIVTIWILLLRGDIVPGSTARLWLESWQVEREAGKFRDEQITKLLEGQETTNKLVSALHDVARDRAPEER